MLSVLLLIILDLHDGHRVPLLALAPRNRPRHPPGDGQAEGRRVGRLGVAGDGGCEGERGGRGSAAARLRIVTLLVRPPRVSAKEGRSFTGVVCVFFKVAY